MIQPLKKYVLMEIRGDGFIIENKIMKQNTEEMQTLLDNIKMLSSSLELIVEKMKNGWVWSMG